MSEKKIQVELPESVARAYASGIWQQAACDVVKEACAAALPPEYPEGTVAWVTFRNGNRWLAQQRGGKWRLDAEHSAAKERELVKVEPLRVLADDEIAVKRILGHMSAKDWREAAASDYTVPQDNLALVYADALEAEARP